MLEWNMSCLLSYILQKFALSATEVGSLINLGSNDSCEFFHDPSMLSRYTFYLVLNSYSFFFLTFLFCCCQCYHLISSLATCNCEVDWILMYSAAGQVRKNLSIKAQPNSSGYFISLSMHVLFSYIFQSNISIHDFFLLMSN